MDNRDKQFYTDLAFKSELHNWRTPDWLFDILHKYFHFQADVCANDSNYLCNKYFTMENSCFDNPWSEMNYMNPPYGRQIGTFLKEALHQWKNYNRMTVALLPSRTDTKWFHNYVNGKAHVFFLRGRLRFNDQPNPAPFPSMIVFWGVDDSRSLNALWEAVQKGRDEQGK